MALTCRLSGRLISARSSGKIQQGRISVYLTYSFFTLLVLLLFVRWRRGRPKVE